LNTIDHYSFLIISFLVRGEGFFTVFDLLFFSGTEKILGEYGATTVDSLTIYLYDRSEHQRALGGSNVAHCSRGQQDKTTTYKVLP